MTPVTQKKTNDTRELLLDAAEKLFARHGYYGTSVRALTKEAHANLASVNYHFGSKHELLEELFSQRFGPLNEKRSILVNEVLQEAAAQNKRPAVSEILRAFIRPVFESGKNLGQIKRLSSLVFMAHAASDPVVLNALVRTFKPAIDVLLTALKAALPSASEDQLRWKVQFFIGGFSQTIRIIALQDNKTASPALPKVTVIDELLETMITYYSAAMEAK